MLWKTTYVVVSAVVAVGCNDYTNFALLGWGIYIA